MRYLLGFLLLSAPAWGQFISFRTTNRITTGAGNPSTGCSVAADVGKVYVKSDGAAGNNLWVCEYNGGTPQWAQLSAGSGAPTDASYITKTANGTLSAEFALGTLSTGFLQVTTTTGDLVSRTLAAGSGISIANADGSGGNPSISVDANTVALRANLQAGTSLTCIPASGSATAYSGCGSMAPTRTALSNGSPTILIPDIQGGASPTLDEDAGTATLSAVNIQKLGPDGALTNLVANDLDTDAIYPLFYKTGPAKYIAVPMEWHFERDATYNYLKMGAAGGNGVWFRHNIGGTTMECIRSDAAANCVLELGTLRGKSTPGGFQGFELNPSATVGTDPVFYVRTAATNDDPGFDYVNFRAATTNATVTTLATISATNSNTTFVEAKVWARRTGGTAGTADDGAAYVRYCSFKAAAGTATQIGSTTDAHTSESQAGWDVTCSASGGNAIIQVTGALDNNVTWHGEAWIRRVGS